MPGLLGLVEDCGQFNRAEIPLTQHPTKFVDKDCPYRADDVNGREGEVMTGTTIMAVVYKGGVMMGADSRTSTGDYIANRASRKISKVHDNVFVCRSGSAADTQALTGMVQDYLGQNVISKGVDENGKLRQALVSEAAALFRIIAYNNKDNLMAGLIVAGHDDQNGPQVYSIPLGGSLIPVPVAIGGSGSGYITGLVDKYYRPDFTREECKDFVSSCIAQAMKADGSSGGCIRMVHIENNDIDEYMVTGDQLERRDFIFEKRDECGFEMNRN